jgi:hypothetical protein
VPCQLVGPRGVTARGEILQVSLLFRVVSYLGPIPLLLFSPLFPRHWRRPGGGGGVAPVMTGGDRPAAEAAEMEHADTSQMYL